MKLYISGPITGMPDMNRAAFDKAAAELVEAGFSVENPAITDVPGWSWLDYMRYDLPILDSCDGVAVLPRWWRSDGAKVEIARALRRGKPVMSVAGWIAWDWRSAA